MKPVHIAFPSIEQYRNVVFDVRALAKEKMQPLPKIIFEGTVKLHGSNASIVNYSENAWYDYWCQSREQIITPEKDNAGFARFVKEQKEDNTCLLGAFINEVKNLYNVSDFFLSVYGEWCGSGIQKNVGISSLPKMFVVFAVSYTFLEKNETHWLSRNAISRVMVNNPTKYRCIFDYPIWTHEVDFSRPEDSQNYFVERTLEVERECPVAKFHSIENGTGEGIVWRGIKTDSDYVTEENLNTFIFKCKGKDHASSHVKTLASIDVEKLDNIRDLADSFCTPARLEQGMQYLKDNNFEFTQKSTGKFIEWMSKDVVKEESDTILGNGFQIKDVMPHVSRLAREFYLKEWQKL